MHAGFEEKNVLFANVKSSIQERDQKKEAKAGAIEDPFKKADDSEIN